ncbi:MAG: DUF2339 domain-containing protein [Limisphaerales bacterium]
MEVVTLFFAGVVLLLPLCALFYALGVNRRVRELEDRVRSLEGNVSHVENAVESLERSAARSSEEGAAVTGLTEVAGEAGLVEEPEDAGLHEEIGLEAPSGVSGPVEAVEEAPAGQGVWEGISARLAAERQAGSQLPPPLPEQELAAEEGGVRAAPAFNWEQFMGVKLIAWLGGLALFLAAAYFVKYSFDNGLIPPEVRVALGYVLGMGLLGGGVKMCSERYRVTAHTLCATGVVILYAATFAAHGVYHFAFFGQLVTFLLMTLTTAVAFLLAVRLRALVVAVLGMLGGFLTPLLLSTGQDNPVGLFGYIALLDLGLLAVALRGRWMFLVGASAVGTFVMQVVWLMQFFVPGKVYVAFVVFMGFALLYLLPVLLKARFRLDEPKGGADLWVGGSAAFMAFLWMGLSGVLMSYDSLAGRPGLIGATLFGGDVCLLVIGMLLLRLNWVQGAGAGVAFLGLSSWTMMVMHPGLLYGGLALYFVFGLLHTAWPFVLRRLQPGGVVSGWVHVFPLLSLLLVAIPVMRLASDSLGVWLVVLMVDVVAILAAFALGSFLGVLGACLMTLALVGGWITRVPAGMLPLELALVLTAGFALLFCGVMWVFARRLIDGKGVGGGSIAAGLLSDYPRLAEQLPSAAAVTPFALLVLLVTRLPLADPSAVFGVALLLLVLVLGLGLLSVLEFLPLIGLGAVLMVEFVWQAQGLAAASMPGMVFGWYVVFSAVFVAYPFLFRRRLGERVVPWVAGALAAPLHFFLLYRVVKMYWPGAFMGWLPLSCAVPMVGCLWGLVRLFPEGHSRRNAVLALFGGAALFFLTLVFPVQFDKQWLTLGWALEGMALCWLYLRVPHNGLKWVGLGLLLVAFLRLGVNPALLDYYPRQGGAIFNWYLYTYGVGAGCMFGAAWLLSPPRDRLGGYVIPPFLQGAGTFLVFLLVNLEISHYFTREGARVRLFDFGGVFARDLSYTVVWALFALVLVVVGLARRLAPARYAGLGLLGLTLLKLFLHDLANLAQLYRVSALAGVAVVAIVASVLYQKFLSRAGDGGGER